MQRSVRENIALPYSGAPSATWGLDQPRPPSVSRSTKAIDTLQIDTRAQGEVRRLSGGNQQKVTIARWVAGGVKTMLCFDPTRGIDIRTKSQIYVLLRDLADAGAAVLLYTSELKEIQLACDRAIVIFGGRVVAEVDAAEADEPTLLRAAYNLRADAAAARRGAAAVVAAEAAVGGIERRERPDPARQPPVRRATQGSSTTATSAPRVARSARDNGWVLGLLVLPRSSSSSSPRSSSPITTPPASQGLRQLDPAAWPCRVAQAVVVISGGIDLSIGSMMALTSVVAATP